MSKSSDNIILALDAGGSFIKLGLVNLSENDTIHGFADVPVNSDGSRDEIEAAYRKAVQTGLLSASEQGFVLQGIGVSTPGPFDYAKGVSLMQHKYRALYGHSLLPLFEQEAGTLTVRFMHDSNAFLLGEIQNPLYRRFKKPCAVLVGTGLGFALMEEGRILTNETGGPKVSIFSRPYRDATSEEYLSKRAIMRLYQQLGGTTCTTVKELDILAHRGDELCRRVFALTAVHAAEILYPIIAHHAIDCIILGGQIAKADELLVLPLQERLHALGVDCFVGKAHTIDAAPLVGAAHLFEEQ